MSDELTGYLVDELFNLHDLVLEQAEPYLSTNTLVVALVTFLFIYVHCVPFNWVYKLQDAGWLCQEDAKHNKRRRKIGNVPPVYPNGWFALAESKNVGRNQVIHVCALGENFAVLRTSSGEVHVLDAYCPHLGANMGVGGKVRDDCLECPFHLWRFSGETGECVHSPTSEKVPRSAKVRKWKSSERNDYIFVWYHAEEEEPTYEIPVLENVRRWKYVGRNEFKINCHIQEIPENGSDQGHFAALHEAAGFAGGDLRTHERRILKFFRHHWESTWEPKSPPHQHVGMATLNHYITLFGIFKAFSTKIHVDQIGPGFVTLSFKTSLGPICLLQTVTPTEPLLQYVTHRMYCPSYLTLLGKYILAFECWMVSRDAMIWNSKMYLDKPLLTKEDAAIAKYRRWFSQFYTEHSPTLEIAREGYDW